MSITQAQTIDTCIVSNIQFEISTSEPIYNIDYQLFIDEQLPYIQSHKQDIKYIKITSSASPDGTYSFNRYLALKRASFISDLIGGGNIDIEAEGYEQLYKLIQQSDEPWKNKILKIISTSNNIKEDLRKSGYWRPLVDHYFPQLRNCTVEVYFSFSEPCIVQPCENDTIYMQNFVYLRDTVFIKPEPTPLPILAVKSNLFADALIAPNIQAELYTHWWGTSATFDYTFPWYHSDKQFVYYQLLRGTIVLRKYLNNEYDKHYIGLYGETYEYDFCLGKEDGWQGEGYGLGIEYGYAFRSKKYTKLKTELFIRAGWLNSRYDTYHAGEPFEGKYYYDWYQKASEFTPRRFVLNYFGPTAIGINISYDVLCLKRFLFTY